MAARAVHDPTPSPQGRNPPRIGSPRASAFATLRGPAPAGLAVIGDPDSPRPPTAVPGPGLPAQPDPGLSTQRGRAARADIVAARAAGTDIGDNVDESHTTLSGTSMATPHVAGAAAILTQ